MHLKSTAEHLKQDPKTMASFNEDDNGSCTSNGNNNNSGDVGGSGSCNNNNNDNKNDDNKCMHNAQTEDAEIKLRKQTLEQRKKELEKLLCEKSWLLQQIQKQETQILNGNYEYLNLNEILSNLAQQYKQTQTVGDNGGNTVILRRKSASKENQNFSNNNIINNRQSEISNRSSEYDNYPGVGAELGTGDGGIVSSAMQQLPGKSAVKKRSTPTVTATLNYVQLQRQQQHNQQLLHQHVEQQILQQHAAEQHLFNQHLQYITQQQMQRKFLQNPHYHHQQQQAQQQVKQQPPPPPPPPPLLLQQQQKQYMAPQADAISLYSVNSANVATLRHQHVAPQQQPIVVQCDKYYLSPTHQPYSDNGFIKSSQNIKKYISPLASPTQMHVTGSYEVQQMSKQPQLLQQHQRQLDAISLAVSYASVGAETTNNIRWRSHTNITHTPTPSHSQDSKSHSSDMIAQLPNSSNSSNSVNYYGAHQPNLIIKPLDEISISSLNSENQKKVKPKQWLESSLDGPVICAQPTNTLDSNANTTSSSRLLQKVHSTARERSKLSSQSMSSGRHYSLSTQKNMHSFKLLQDDDGRYAKLSQSTSYLNSMETASMAPLYNKLDMASVEILATKQLPPKSNVAGSAQPAPPPRPPPATAEKSTAALSPDIRIESPKNMTVVQQATFQPYKEVTKPFEMADFYKYSTKFRQKDTSDAVENT